MVHKILLIASVLISLTKGNLVPFITPCLSTDEDCITKNVIKSIPLFADGIPEYGVKTLDPLFYKNIDSSSPNLKLLLSDVTLKGLKTCKPLKVTRDKSKSKLLVKLSCAMNIDGDYEMEGQILITKIVGKGKAHAFLPNLEITMDIETVEKEKDGKVYLRMKRLTHSFDVKGNSELVFQGLLQDNQVLAQATDDLIKNSSNEIMKEIGGKLFETAVTTVTGTLNRFFGKVPEKDYSLD